MFQFTLRLFEMKSWIARFCLALFFLFSPPFGGKAGAAPALYWLWMSKADGSRICSQAALGEGWRRVAGPFKDGRCRKPA
ncbi:MAG: hypothetical protein LBO00_07470 [Zoogloeaceae bacterium]|nr:hypothetical protein [Zoogloeaceae bacterium]